MINRHNLAIAIACQKEGNRYTTQSILVTPNETVATDGHRLLRVSNPPSEAEHFPYSETFAASDSYPEFQLPAKDAKLIEKQLPNKPAFPVLGCVAIDGARTAKNGNAYFGISDGGHVREIAVSKPEGKFPDWKGVMPTGEPTFQITVDAAIIADILTLAAKAIPDPKKTLAPVTLTFYAPDQAFRIDGVLKTTEQQWTAVVMPLRPDAKNVNEF